MESMLAENIQANKLKFDKAYELKLRVYTISSLINDSAQFSLIDLPSWPSQDDAKSCLLT